MPLIRDSLGPDEAPDIQAVPSYATDDDIKGGVTQRYADTYPSDSYDYPPGPRTPPSGHDVTAGEQSDNRMKSSFSEVFNSAFDSMKYGAGVMGSTLAKSDYADSVIAKLRESGVPESSIPANPTAAVPLYPNDAQDPALPSIYRTAINKLLRDQPDWDGRDQEPLRQKIEQAFNDQVQAVAHDRPELSDLANLQSGQVELSNQARETAENVSSRADPFARIAGGLSGELAAGATDPINWLMLAVAPEGKIAESLGLAGRKLFAGKTLEHAVTTGLVGGSIATAEAPLQQARNKELGLDNGLIPALDDIWHTFLGGTVLGGGAHLTGEAANFLGKLAEGPKTVKALEQALAPDATGIGDQVAPRVGGEIAHAIEAAHADYANAPPKAPMVPADENLRAYEDAIRHGQNPDTVPQPIPPVVAGEPIAGSEVPESGTIGERKEILGKPTTFENLSFNKLQTDANLMQFKEGGDQYGVTNALRYVQEWDTSAADDPLMVWRRGDGANIVANGHQRTGLALRLMAEQPERYPDITGNARVFAENDGWTADEVRALAAKRNIQQGTGSVVDIAKVLRASPSIYDKTINPSDPKIKAAKGLANLSPDAFQMVTNGLVPENYASLVGQIAQDPSMHTGLLSDLMAIKPSNEAAARFVIQTGLENARITEIQDTLFGKEEAVRTLMPERAKVFGNAVRILSQDSKVFSTLDRERQSIEEAGNKLLGGTANADRATQSSQLAQILEKLASTHGPVSDLLNRHAQLVSEGADAKQAGRGFVDDLVRLFREKGLKNLVSEATPRREIPEPVLTTTAKHVDNQISMLESDLGIPKAEEGKEGEKTPAKPVAEPVDESKIINDEIEKGWSEEQKLARIRELTAENKPIIDKFLKQLDADLGTESKSSVKAEDNIVSKAHRPTIVEKKPWHDVDHVRDTYRFKSVMDNIGQLPEIIDRLRSLGATIVKPDVDKVLKPKEFGFRIAAMDLRMPNGQLIEYYMPLREMEEAKKNGGHELFERVRNLDPKAPENREIYNATTAESRAHYEKAWQAYLARTGETEEYVRASLDRAMASAEDARTYPSSNSVNAALGAGTVHLPAELRAAEKSPGPKTKAAGEPSSSVKAKTSDITHNISEKPVFASEPGAEGKPQTLVPGVAPVTDRDRAQLAMSKPLRGGNLPPQLGGLFDMEARDQTDLFNTVPVSDQATGADMRPELRGDVLNSEPRESLVADLLEGCKV